MLNVLKSVVRQVFLYWFSRHFLKSAHLCLWCQDTYPASSAVLILYLGKHKIVFMIHRVGFAT